MLDGYSWIYKENFRNCYGIFWICVEYIYMSELLQAFKKGFVSSCFVLEVLLDSFRHRSFN